MRSISGHRRRKSTQSDGTALYDDSRESHAGCNRCYKAGVSQRMMARASVPKHYDIALRFFTQRIYGQCINLMQVWRAFLTLLRNHRLRHCLIGKV